MSILDGISSPADVRGLPAHELPELAREIRERILDVVGKGGGLTISEALAKGKPLLFYGAVPGQELRNAKFITGKKAGFVLEKFETLASCIKTLQSESDKADAMRAAARALGRSHAAWDIACAVMS